MSYSIDIAFKCNVEPEDVLTEAEKFLEYKMNHIKDEPIFISKYDFDDEYSIINDNNLMRAIQAFTYKLVYWKQYKLLGIVSGRNNPDDYFTTYFQNSTDTDYNITDFPDDELFTTMYNEGMSISNDQIIIDKEISEEDIERTDFEYYKRVNAYDTIVDKLDIMGILYDHSNITNSFYIIPSNIHTKKYDIVKSVYYEYKKLFED